MPDSIFQFCWPRERFLNVFSRGSALPPSTTGTKSLRRRIVWVPPAAMAGTRFSFAGLPKRVDNMIVPSSLANSAWPSALVMLTKLSIPRGR